MNKKIVAGLITIIVIVGVVMLIGCVEKPPPAPTVTPTPSLTETPAAKFGEVPYLIIEDSSVLPSDRVEEWHKMEIINYTTEVEEGWRNKYEIDIDIWIRNTYNLPVDWIEVDVEYINEWNQTYIETDLWSEFIKPNEIDKTYTHTAGEYIPQIKEIHVWGHEDHPK
jgi:hypothetical protein